MCGLQQAFQSSLTFARNAWGFFYKTFFWAVINSASASVIVSHFLLTLTNTLAFFVTELITAVESFMIQAFGDNHSCKFCATMNEEERKKKDLTPGNHRAALA